MNQFKIMIDDFCNELINPKSSKYNFEKEILAQARVMEAARRSNIKHCSIMITKIK